MSVGEKLGQGAAQIQEAWTTLADSWMTAAHDLVGSASADPFGLLQPDVVMGRVFDFTRRAAEINWDLISSLTGVSLTAEVAVRREGATAARAVATQMMTPIEVPSRDVEEAHAAEPPKPGSLPSEQKATGPIAAENYSRVSKAELQKALTARNLPKSGTVKELRERLIEADGKAAH